MNATIHLICQWRLVIFKIQSEFIVYSKRTALNVEIIILGYELSQYKIQLTRSTPSTFQA